MADEQPIPEVARQTEDSRDLTPEHVMQAMAIISQFLYKVENEPRHEVHPYSYFQGRPLSFDLSPFDIAEFFEEQEDLENKFEEAKGTGPSTSSSEATPKKAQD
ncbi:hypothetical protein RHGRI_030758 [Rhododendron griersonianum]|uniref:Uncharacterized protein n=1 Tax=Rhododendron griersonianum TaxID=479676 RepID=A0AAV6I7R0_9ERIC|nr:hypothetical protein RHGRI_030758 [Rhododendron griersonianum]